jgi:hypothetical protein
MVILANHFTHRGEQINTKAWYIWLEVLSLIMSLICFCYSQTSNTTLSNWILGSPQNFFLYLGWVLLIGLLIWDRTSLCQLSGSFVQAHYSCSWRRKQRLAWEDQNVMDTISKNKHWHNNEPRIKVYSNIEILVGMVF